MGEVQNPEQLSILVRFEVFCPVGGLGGRGNALLGGEEGGVEQVVSVEKTGDHRAGGWMEGIVHFRFCRGGRFDGKSVSSQKRWVAESWVTLLMVPWWKPKSISSLRLRLPYLVKLAWRCS